VPPVAQPFPLFIPLQKLSGVPAEYSYCSIQLHVPNATNLGSNCKKWCHCPQGWRKINRIRGLWIVINELRFPTVDSKSIFTWSLPPQPINMETWYFNIIANIEESSNTTSSSMQKDWTVMIGTIEDKYQANYNRIGQWTSVGTDLRCKGMTGI
jgi:hypothetical protein